MRKAIGLGTVTAVMAAALLCGTAVTADAGRRAQHRNVELVRPTLGPDADARGVLRVKSTKRGEKGVLKLRGLEPRTRYEVRDATTDEVLGSVRTNRRGKAKMKLRRRVRDAGKRKWFEVPGLFEIFRVRDDRPVLMGAADGTVPPARDEMPAFGFAHYDGADGWRGAVDMLSFADRDVQRFSLTLSHAPTERGERGDVYDYVRGAMTDTRLPLGVESVAGLAGRAFRVLAPDGSVLLRGVLPDLEQPRMRMPPIFDFPGRDGLPGRDDAPLPDRPAPEDDRAERDAAAKTDYMGAAVGVWNELGASRDLPRFDFDLPDFDDPMRRGDLFDFLPPDFMPFPQPEREPSRLRLEIADDDGNLTDVGNLDRIVFTERDWWGDDRWPWDCRPFDDVADEVDRAMDDRRGR